MSTYDLSPRLDNDAVERMLDMIRRHGPRLLREGGGSLTSEGRTQTNIARSRVTAEQTAKACEMAGAHATKQEIAAATGLSISAVSWVLRDNGLKAKDSYNRRARA